MRAAIIFSVIFVLGACLLRSTEAVTCTADPTVTGCTDCSLAANAADAECVAEAAASTTTVAPTTVAPTTVASTSATATTAATSTSTGPRRKIVRMTNFQFAGTRRYRIYRNRNRSSTSRTTNRNRRTNVRRVNVRNRRGNGNVRVIVG